MILGGDCLEKLKELDADSIDSLVTDPPAGISFMGKEWDHHKGGRDEWVSWLTDVMRECFRVMKPGAHGLVWAIPRTSHWTATALENAGFEIRDVVTHLFGSGFPKSMDISKAIDKAAGVEREVVGVAGKSGSKRMSMAGDFTGGKYLATAPATEAAKKWQGWGTALKPASEHWILIRKPISEKTVAKNVLKHGTGGINIDGSRVVCDLNAEDLARGRKRSISNNPISGYKTNGRENYQAATGRFPANLVFSHNDDCEDECSGGCAVKELDEQSGNLGKSAGGNSKNVGNKIYGSYAAELDKKPCGFGDSGGASRFFKCFDAHGVDGINAPCKKSTNANNARINLLISSAIEKIAETCFAHANAQLFLDWANRCLNVPSAESQLKNIATEPALEPVRTLFKSAHQFDPCLDFTNALSDSTLRQCHAEIAERLENIGIMKIIQTQAQLHGFASLVTDAIITLAKNALKSKSHQAKFAYIAKASKSDRGVGNGHPTVKSTKLMSYLVRLITPEGGTVLDPFMGSGSTGVAAKKEGFGFIGIEREPEYLDIAGKRIAEATCAVSK
ncbi:MAG: DNA methyltransferase [Polynucleobacter sp.]